MANFTINMDLFRKIPANSQLYKFNLGLKLAKPVSGKIDCASSEVNDMLGIVPGGRAVYGGGWTLREPERAVQQETSSVPVGTRYASTERV